MLFIDESDFSKKGDSSVGVVRQYNGRLGKVDNCQVGVFAARSLDKRSTLIGGRLFLPEAWIKDRSGVKKKEFPRNKESIVPNQTWRGI